MIPPPEYVEKFEFDPSKVKVYNPVVLFLGGLKLGLTVLALIAIASTIGEFLPNDEKFALRLVFKTWWYRGLLALMGLNLILNTYITYVEQTYPQFLPLFRKNPDHYKTLRIHNKAAIKDSKIGDSKSLMKSLAEALHRKGYRAFFDGSGLYAHRGLFARFGSTITHMGLITIIVGSLAESYWKTDGTFAAVEGDTIDYYSLSEKLDDKQPLGFKVKVRDFEFTEYPGTSIASKFKSTVSFIPEKGEPWETYVRVNHDVDYGGWTFHQSSYRELKRDEWLPRYFVNLSEKGPDQQEILHRFETYLDPRGREITPIPGKENSFFCIEPDSTGRGAIWTVASKEAVLARGVKSLFGDLKIEMLKFYPDLAVESDRGVFNRSGSLRNPAAFIEIAADNTVAYRQWVFPKDHDMGEDHSGHGHDGEPHPGGEGTIDFVIADVDYDPLTPEKAAITVALKNHQTGNAMSETYRLSVGTALPMARGLDPGLGIPGNYSLDGLHSIPAYITYLAVSKNPGIPVVWMGAILASFGPFIAFFVSRRRVWAHWDEAKKALWIGGESRYSREALEDEIAETVQEWGASEEVKAQPPIKFPLPTERGKLSQYL